MTALPTTPPFPDQSSAQADQMLRELYSRIQTLETTIRITGDGEDPQDLGFRVLSTTPMRMLSGFIHRSKGVYDGTDHGHELLGTLVLPAIVLSVTASISEVFDNPFQTDVQLVVGTSIAQPNVPEPQDEFAPLFFAHSPFRQQNLASLPWVNMNMQYEFTGSDNRQGVGRFLAAPDHFPVIAQWRGTGYRFGAGEAHVVVLYVDSDTGATVESLADVTLVRPVDPGTVFVAGPP